jgi:DnaJ-domain-containing protein 1
MKEDGENQDLNKRIDELESSLSIALEINDRYQRENVALKNEMEELRAELARSKEEHQYDKLVYQKELESLKNPLHQLRNKGLV